MKLNNFLPQNYVIPAQAGIQSIIKSPAKRGIIKKIRFAEFLSFLDSRLRGNDE